MADLKLYNWQSITDEFKTACDGLEIGELIKDPNFGLFEAMSAIELMDPKMDAGMLSNQSQAKIKSFDQAIKDNLVKIDDFTLEEKMAIVDNTFCNLVTWLDGTSLAQTLFTNLYFHDPNQVKDAYIQYFSIAMLKIVDSMRSKILAASVFEEEDFQPMNYNFKFCQDILDSVVLNNLKNIEDTYAKSYRHLKGEIQTIEDSEKISHQLKIDLSYGLWMRIKFVRNLFQLMQNSDEHQFFFKNSEDVAKYINNCQEALSKFENTNKLGIQPEYIKNGKTIYPVVMGFEPCINQRLLPPTFPRFIKIQSFESTLKCLNELLTELTRALKVNHINNFKGLFEFCLDFSNGNQTLLLRSLLQLIVLPRSPMDKLIKTKEFLKDTVKKFIAPPSLEPKCILYNKDITVQLVDNFLNKCSPVFISIINILGNNKARQREKFGYILDDLATLQEEADNVDRILHSVLLQTKSSINHLACFGSWILYNSLTIMNLYLLSGFELDLYSKYEYHYVHWYICEVILNWLINTLNRTESFLVTSEQTFTIQNKKKPNKKKIKSFYEKEIALLTANRHMHSAYYQAMRAFKLEEYIKSPNQEFDCEEFRYNHRFGVFQCFNTPTICMYYQYKEKDDHFINTFSLNKIYSFAQEHFDLAKQIYDKYSNDSTLITSCSRISKTNFVVMRLLSSGLKNAEKLDLNNSEDLHFPIIKI